MEGVSYICCDDNWKFHGRFALALICKEKYVAVFDDDVVPGKDWFASCVEHAEYGILGSSGVILPPVGYLPNSKVGHIGKHNQVVEKVDLVGHSWFAKQEYFRYMFYEKTYSHDNGEDIQLAALAKKYGGVECYVPPHPISNTDIWGCLPQYNNLGNDKVATSSNPQAHYKLRGEIVEWYKKTL